MVVEFILGECMWQNGKLPKYQPDNRNNTKGGMCMTDYEIFPVLRRRQDRHNVLRDIS